MTPTPEQEAFFAAEGPTALIAVAGSGKSTSIEQKVRRLKQPCRPVVLAFNRDIANAMSARLPHWATANTFHSYCLQALKMQLGRLDKPNSRKMAGLLKEAVPTWRDRKNWEDDFLTLCSRAKALGYGVLFEADPATLEAIADDFGLDCQRFDLADQLLAKSLGLRTNLDFDDMLLHAVAYNAPFDWCTHLLVDEAQDTNAVQAEVIARILGKTGQLTLVGDPCQAIYGFRGAGANAMEDLIKRFGCQSLPLSFTWRCSQAVVGEARKWESRLDPNGVIKAREGAEQGLVSALRGFKEENFKPGSAILCRNGAPAVGMAFALTRRRIPCYILGKDMAAGLERLLKKVEDKPNPIDTLINWRDSECRKLEAGGKSREADGVRDRCSCLREFLTSSNNNIAAAKSLITKMFSATTGVALATIHKAKGLEWDKVFLLDPELMPSITLRHRRI